MDIKEIAEQVSKRIYVEDGLLLSKFISEKFAEALISAYKDELLKEVGEPVLYAEFAEDGGWLGDASEYADHLEEPHALFTSDQLAAAILKATKPLEEVKEALGEYLCSADDSPAAVRRLVSAYQERNNSAAKYCSQLNEQDAELEQLRAQLAAAQEENGRLENQVLARDAELWGRTQEILGLKDQLAKAEQRVAEACKSMCLRLVRKEKNHAAGYGIGYLNYSAQDVADFIDNGEWRKFVKEV